MRKKPQKNKYPKPRKKVQFRVSFFQKGIDFFEKRCIIYLLRKALRNPREWRNWQTRTFEGRVDNTVRVQVPFPAPKKQVGNRLPVFFCSEMGYAEPVAPKAPGNVWRFARQMTDIVRKDKLAVERSETGSTVPFPAPKKQVGNRLPAFLFGNGLRRTSAPQSVLLI